MATTKKPATKKTPTKAAAVRKAPVKKAPVKRAPAKAAPVKTAVVKKTAPVKRKAPAKKKEAVIHSFRVAENIPPFTSFKITRQTVYWLILVCVIIFAQLWILKTQYEVIYLLDQQLLDSVI